MLKFDWNILFTLINLVIFYLLMKKFLFGPITRAMDKRKEMIDKNIKDAGDAMQQAEGLKEQYESKLENAEGDAREIIDKARQTAKEEYGRIIDRANEDAAEMKAAAEKQAQLESEKQIRAARESIASLAIEAAEKVVGQSVSVKSDSDLFDEFLNEGSDINES
ncbi:MAG: F0F1 ATP synthase subunit B [Clostridiales bacterium]|nr:F0F1 ATP synthase subunit B [Clostridiales bacterium]